MRYPATLVDVREFPSCLEIDEKVRNTLNLFKRDGNMYYMDCHCHISVNGHLQDPELFIEKIYEDSKVGSKGFFNVMSTYGLDLEFLAALIDLDRNQLIVPYFGIHPWYSHLFSINRSLTKREHYSSILGVVAEDLLEILPEPTHIDEHIGTVKRLISKCEAQGRTYGFGEMGLDKVFRVPTNGFYGNQEYQSNVCLTNLKVSMEHQKQIFVRQLALANEYKKPVSLHCVKAHGPFFDILHSSFLNIPAVILHSFTGSSQDVKRWKKAFKGQARSLYFSLSSFINGDTGKQTRLKELLNELSLCEILFESDMPIDHYYLNNNASSYFELLEQIQKRISAILNLSEEELNFSVEQNSRRLHSFGINHINSN